jgi:hypothetical protein
VDGEGVPDAHPVTMTLASARKNGSGMGGATTVF